MNFSLAKQLFVAASQIAAFVSTRIATSGWTELQQLILLVVIGIGSILVFWKAARFIVQTTFLSAAWVLAVRLLLEASKSEYTQTLLDAGKAVLVDTLQAYDDFVANQTRVTVEAGPVQVSQQ